MLNVRQILVTARGRTVLMVCIAAAAAGLAACGQRGALYLPSDPAAAQRATLPQLITPGGSSASANEAAPKPAAASSAPAAATTGNGATK